MAGVYKAVFISSDGKENYATFTVQSGSLLFRFYLNFLKFKFASAAPEFYEKPKIVQKEKDGKQVIEIRIRAKSHLEMKAEWQKVVKKDDLMPAPAHTYVI